MAFANCCCYATDVVECEKNEVLDLSSWMTALPEVFKDRPLRELVIPGSHDSFTFSLDKNSNVGPDEPQWLQDLVKRIGIVGRPIVYNWSVCQDKSTLDQLNLGVRYFDFRLGKTEPSKKRVSKRSKSYKLDENSTKPDIRIIHGLFGSTIQDIVQDMATFLKDHPEEVVILDFQHFYGCDPKDLKFVANVILDAFRGKLCPATCSNPTLKSLNRQGWQVIVVNKFVDECQSMTPDIDNYLWPRWRCPNPWANTTSVSVLSSFLDDGLRSRNPKELFVSQVILTPNVQTVVLHLFSKLKTILVPQCNKFLVSKWIPSLAKESDHPPNIIMADFIDSDLSKAIINLNFTRDC